MSYPRLVQTLIIEDDPLMFRNVPRIFQTFQAEQRQGRNTLHCVWI